MTLWLTALKASQITLVLRDVPGPYQRRTSSRGIMVKAIAFVKGTAWSSPESSRVFYRH
jgi:hypothetical protein